MQLFLFYDNIVYTVIASDDINKAIHFYNSIFRISDKVKYIVRRLYEDEELATKEEWYESDGELVYIDLITLSQEFYNRAHETSAYVTSWYEKR